MGSKYPNNISPFKINGQTYPGAYLRTPDFKPLRT